MTINTFGKDKVSHENQIFIKSEGRSKSVHFDKIIKNANLPVCQNCIYYKNTIINTPEFSKCSKFGTKNIITGKVNYSYADLSRGDELLCGHKGKHFTQVSIPSLRRFFPYITIIVPSVAYFVIERFV